jgi:hypothetical protein
LPSVSSSTNGGGNGGTSNAIAYKIYPKPTLEMYSSSHSENDNDDMMDDIHNNCSSIEIEYQGSDKIRTARTKDNNSPEDEDKDDNDEDHLILITSRRQLDELQAKKRLDTVSTNLLIFLMPILLVHFCFYDFIQIIPHNLNFSLIMMTMTMMSMRTTASNCNNNNHHPPPRSN